MKRQLQQLNNMKLNCVLLIVFFNVVSCFGQECDCKNVYVYDTFKNNTKLNECFKNCHILADKISLLYKLYDFGNGNLILPNQEYIKVINSEDNYMVAKKEIIDYLQNPFLINFSEVKLIDDSIIFKKPIKAQKVIIDTREVFQDNDYIRFGCFGCHAIYTDTVYIVGSSNPIFLSSRYLNSNLNFILKDNVISRIYSNEKIKKNNYKYYINLYYKLLELRNINISRNLNKKKYISIENYGKISNIILNKKTIKTALKKIIEGGRFDEMFQF